jgi:DNA end-binding protein Ku
MARAIWTGSINFGLVSIPVGLYSATEDHTVHFHQFQRGTADRIRYQRVNERTGKEVDYADIVKGRDVGGGDYVIVEPKELDDIAPGRSRSIDITSFIDADDIDPVYFQKTYWLAPDGEQYARPYALLVEAMERTNRAGIATFVMRGKEYLTAIRADDGVLALQTLFFADEIRDPAEAQPPAPTEMSDLLAALQRSVDAARSGGRKSDTQDEPDLTGASKADLTEMARDLGVEGRSKMTRDELRDAVTEASGTASKGGRKAS